ncbi:MAG: MFS transporter, partial [Burkholderiales bacterium]
DWRFYAIALGVLATAFINTGIFFQYKPLIDSRGWSLHSYTTSFIAFSIGNVAGSLLIGALIDRFRSINIMVFYLIPLFLGLLILQQYNKVGAIYNFMLGAGLSQGASSVLVSSVWSELYGPQYVGTIRSWVVALQVLATGLAPVLFGWLLSVGITINAIILLCAVYTLISIGLLLSVRWLGLRVAV